MGVDDDDDMRPYEISSVQIMHIGAYLPDFTLRAANPPSKRRGQGCSALIRCLPMLSTPLLLDADGTSRPAETLTIAK